MIDITPYQQKLTWLQEWVELKIDSQIIFVVINHIYEQTGQLIKVHPDSPVGWEFEVYCAYRQQQEANIKYVTN